MNPFDCAFWESDPSFESNRYSHIYCSEFKEMNAPGLLGNNDVDNIETE